MNVYTYIPEEKGYTKQKAIKKIFFMLIVPVIMSIFLGIKTQFNYNPAAYGIIGLLICFVILNVFFSRYPIKIEISEISKSLRIHYLNGFGNEKEDIIAIQSAQIRYINRSSKNPSAGKQFRIIQNLFSNWIHVDQSHGFGIGQIEDIYNKTILLKDS